MSKRALFFLARNLEPADNGRKVRLKKILQATHELGIQVEIAFFTKEISKEDRNFLSDISSAIYHLSINSGFSLFKKVIAGVSFLRPLQISIFENQTNLTFIKKLIKDGNYDYFYFDMLRTGIYLQQLSDEVRKKSILDMDDLLSKRYENETGYNHAKGLNQLDNKLVGTAYKLIGSLITKYEASSMRRLEKRIAELNVLIALVSNNERNELAKKVDQRFEHNIVHLPLTGSKKKGVTRDLSKLNKQRIGFIGNLSLRSNFNGLCYFLNQNSIFLSKNNIVVDIIGNAPNFAKNQLLSISNKNQIKLNIRGFVPELNTFTNKWLLAIAPNRTGTGINTKIFDYLALSVPILGYSYAFRGFENLRNLFLFEIDDGKVEDNYNYLSSMSEEEYAELVAKESNMYNSEYSPKVLKSNLEKIYGMIDSRE